MVVNLGDIVLVENHEKENKKNTYIVTHITKGKNGFRGIQVVKYLRNDQNLKEIVDVPNGYFVILTKVSYKLRTSDVCAVVDGVGEEIGLSVDKTWQKFHSDEVRRYWRKARSCSGLFTKSEKVQPAKITRIYHGGKCGGK